jgi:hypothetical protein
MSIGQILIILAFSLIGIGFELLALGAALLTR